MNLILRCDYLVRLDSRLFHRIINAYCRECLLLNRLIRFLNVHKIVISLFGRLEIH